MSDGFPPAGFGDAMAGRLHGDRTVMATGRLDEASAARVSQELLMLAAASDDPVRVLFAMHGDQLDPAFSLYDVVSTMTPRVRMIATGRVAGAAVVAFCAAAHADRTCLPMARFHLHAFRTSAHGEAGRLQGEADAASEAFARARDLIAAAADVPPARVEDDLRQGLQLDAREAETYGLVARLTMRGEL